MVAPNNCLTRDQLRQLLDDSLSSDEQQVFTGHLDSCNCCQLALEHLASGDGTLLDFVCESGRAKPPSESAFWPAYRELENATGQFDGGDGVTSETAVEVKLDFLLPSDKPGHLGKLGYLEVVNLVGRGGMGVVLHAIDPCLQRDVAIKVLAPELADNEVARKRFCREARTAARVAHENLVAVHYVDEDEATELPFLVMQYVAGESLDQRMTRGRLGLKEIVRIGAQAAAGLAAAHRIGLIHRDIKPGNILLESGTDRVKLTDFGLARAAEDVKLTSTGFVAGTPLYMAPEQARGEDVDHRGDLFSLGTVLYEMATGRPPFEGKTPLAVLRRVADEQHLPVQSLNPEIPDWLAAVIDRLLEKKPDDRIQTAAEVTEILSQQLARMEPAAPVELPTSSRQTAAIAARRGVLGRLPHWAVPLLIGIVVGALAWAMLAPRKLADATDTGTPPRANLVGNSGAVWGTAFSPDATRLAMAIDDGRILLWDLQEQRVVTTLTGHTGAVWSVDFNRDGSRLVTASDDGTVRIWDPATGRALRSLPHPSSVRTAGFSPDGKRVISGDRSGAVRVWDLESAKDEPVYTFDKLGGIYAVAFSPDGRTAASAGIGKVVKLWDVTTGQPRLDMPGHAGPIYGLAFSPDGHLLASASWDGTVRLWDVDSGSPGAVLQAHAQDFWSVSFDRDGKTIASAGQDGSVRVWDVATAKEMAVFRGHRGAVHSVRFAPDGSLLASGGRDGTAKIWNVPH